MRDENNKFKKQKGFTLIEVLFVVIISSLFISMVVVLYNQYLAQMKIKRTDANIATSIDVIGDYFSFAYAYPCPADRSLTPDDEFYLRSFQTAFGTPSNFCDVRGLVMGSGCTITGSGGGGITGSTYNVDDCNGCTANNGLCVVPGARDIDGSGTIGDSHEEIVVIGAVPVRDIRDTVGLTFSDSAAFDGYGSILTYAVSRKLAHEDEFVFHEGVISVVDELGRDTSGVNNNAHYALVSHGENRRGGFGLGGAMINPCGLSSTDLTLPSSSDAENCDADAQFVQTIRRNGTDINGYDDTVKIEVVVSTRLWANIRSNLTNINQGFMSVNLPIIDDVPTEPEQMVHVAGDVRVDGNLRTNTICVDSLGTPNDTSDDNCFNPDIFRPEPGGHPSETVFECPDGMYATRLDLSQPTISEQLGCRNLEFAAVNGNCGTGWVRGFNMQGDVICEPNPDAPTFDNPSVGEIDPGRTYGGGQTIDPTSMMDLFDFDGGSGPADQDFSGGAGVIVRP